MHAARAKCTAEPESSHDGTGSEHTEQTHPHNNLRSSASNQLDAQVRDAGTDEPGADTVDNVDPEVSGIPPLVEPSMAARSGPSAAEEIAAQQMDPMARCAVEPVRTRRSSFVVAIPNEHLDRTSKPQPGACPIVGIGLAGHAANQAV